MQLLMRFLGFTLLLFTLLPLQASAAYSNIYTFGDSLSDTGNVFTQRSANPFNNGVPWVDYLAKSMGTPWAGTVPGVNNFAHVGARAGSPFTYNHPISGPTAIPSVVTQTSIFSSVSTASIQDNASSLFILWGGGNDMLDAGTAYAATGLLDTARIVVDLAVSHMMTAIGNLMSEGASEFLVPNMPNLGRVPLGAATDPATATQLSQYFNVQLAGGLDQLVATAPLPIEIHQLDVFTLLEDVMATPSGYGLTNATDPCVVNLVACTNPDEYLFWDDFHPTTRGHEIIAAAAIDALNPVPLPAAAWLFAGGLALLGVVRRRA